MLVNTGVPDRIIRFIIACGLIVAAVLADNTLPAIVLYVLAGVALATAAVGFCPLYRLLGWSTKRNRS